MALCLEALIALAQALVLKALSVAYHAQAQAQALVLKALVALALMASTWTGHHLGQTMLVPLLSLPQRISAAYVAAASTQL